MNLVVVICFHRTITQTLVGAVYLLDSFQDQDHTGISSLTLHEHFHLDSDHSGLTHVCHQKNGTSFLKKYSSRLGWSMLRATNAHICH